MGVWEAYLAMMETNKRLPLPVLETARAIVIAARDSGAPWWISTPSAAPTVDGRLQLFWDR